MEFPEIKVADKGEPDYLCARAIGIKRGITEVKASIDKCVVFLNNNEIVNLYRTHEGLRVTRLFQGGVLVKEDGAAYLLALRMYRGDVIDMVTEDYRGFLVEVQQTCGSYMDVTSLPTADWYF